MCVCILVHVKLDIHVNNCYFYFCTCFSSCFILFFLVYWSVLLHNHFDSLSYLKLHGIRHARNPGGAHCTNTMSIWNSNKQLYVLPCLLRSAFSEFLDQSKLLFFISFLLPSFLSVFAFFYYTWSCRVMSLASVVDIFGQESRRLLQKLVSVSGIPKYKRTATSWTGCFVTVNTNFVRV